MPKNITIGEATALYDQKKLVIGQPQYRGRSSQFMPILDAETGEPVDLNPLSFRVNGSVIPARKFLLEKGIVLSDAQRFGLALVAWLNGYDEVDKWALAEDICQFLGEPDGAGNVNLTLHVGPYFDRRESDGGNGSG